MFYVLPLSIMEHNDATSEAYNEINGSTLKISALPSHNLKYHSDIGWEIHPSLSTYWVYTPSNLTVLLSILLVHAIVPSLWKLILYSIYVLHHTSHHVPNYHIAPVACALALCNHAFIKILNQ